MCASCRVTLAHIFAHVWYQNTENRMALLPPEIRDLIDDIGINSPSNAMLLQKDYASAFDEGKFAIRLNSRSQYEVVAIAADYLDFDGFLLYDGVTAAEIGSYGILPMDSRLLQFQLKCAVLRNMKAAAEPVDLEFQCDDELADIAADLSNYAALSPEVISLGLKWWVVEEFILDMSERNKLLLTKTTQAIAHSAGEVTDELTH